MSSVAANWNSLALHLKFSMAETDIIKANVTGVSGRTEFCFNRVISAWLDGPRENVTRAVLADAVEKSDFRNLAEEIRRDSE